MSLNYCSKLTGSLFLGLIICLAPIAMQAQTRPIRTIILDAGHGGIKSGTSGLHSLEKNVCLGISLKLGKMIEKEMPEVKLVYIRTADVHVDNRVRAELANASKGDLYVAIHANAMPKLERKKFIGYKTEVYYTGSGKNKKKRTRKVKKYKTYYVNDVSAKGTETYIWAADRTEAKGDFVAERVSEEDSTEFKPDLNDPTFKAKSLLWTKRYFDKSLLLATYVEDEFKKGKRLSRGVKQRNEEGIWILQATAMPSILVESGFLSNPTEENYLNSKKGQEEVATSVFNAIKRYRVATEGKAAVSRTHTPSRTAPAKAR
ncbi:MAG: N-acetylmuramoyl-L-alanine amidase [Chitinophagaceae bacterium]